MKVHGILLSGGTGERMGAGQPKQFLTLLDMPVLRWSAESLSSFCERPLVVVAPAAFLSKTREILSGLETLVVEGGASRHDSTLCGILALSTPAADDIVFIHDAARPLISPAELRRLQSQFEDPSLLCASLVGPVVETIVKTDEDGRQSAGIVNRESLRAVKTPQAFRFRAWETLQKTTGAFTDLLSWAEAARIPAALCAADASNTKLTSPSDLVHLASLAKALRESGS